MVWESALVQVDLFPLGIPFSLNRFLGFWTDFGLTFEIRINAAVFANLLELAERNNMQSLFEVDTLKIQVGRNFPMNECLFWVLFFLLCL